MVAAFAMVDGHSEDDVRTAKGHEVPLVVGAGGGLDWVLAGVLLVFVSASINAWVLLVEIKR